MSISGSLETFSLPELFQIIDRGQKTGKLLFNINSNNTQNQPIDYVIWFFQGHFVSVNDSSNTRSLIAEEIEKSSWENSKLLLQSKYNCPKNKALGTYLLEQNLITEAKIDLLFESQVDTIRKLFKVSSAKFKFEDLDSNHQIFGDGTQFPYQQMTGKQKRASIISLEAMRDFSDWSRFAEEIPAGNMGLQQLIAFQNEQLSFLESYLWNVADGSTSLEAVARKIGISLKEVQQTALSMILAGLVEETPVIKVKTKMPTASQLSMKPSLVGNSNVATELKDKSQVSNSLVNNLMSFLRNKF